MKQLFKLSLLLIISMVACNRGPVYQSTHTFKNAAWDRFDIIKFTIPVHEEGDAYDIYFTLKHTEAFTDLVFPVYLIMNTPSGEERMREITLKTNRNESTGEVQADSTRLIRIPVWKGLSVSEKGDCILSVENIYPKIQTLGIEQIGIVVEKAGKNGKEKEEK